MVDCVSTLGVALEIGLYRQLGTYYGIMQACIGLASFNDSAASAPASHII